MKLDAPLRDLALDAVGDEARRLEHLGIAGVWSFETRGDPFFPLVQAALATERLGVGTNVAVAFARSPFSMAASAWDLQRASRGRLTLGLGTQVRAHVERRFSMPFEHPAARVTDYINCLRAIWRCFQHGEKPSYRGPFYRFELINDFFNPGPIDHPRIPVYLAGVNPCMARAAGEVADGFSVHPMHSTAYLREVVRPAIDEGARRRGSTVSALTLLVSCFIVRGSTAAERAHAEARVRRQIAFYASTPSYRRVLDFHGHGAVGQRLSALMRAGREDEMAALIPDDLLAELAVSTADGDLATLLGQRYGTDLAQRIVLYDGVEAQAAEAEWRELARRLHHPQAGTGR